MHAYTYIVHMPFSLGIPMQIPKEHVLMPTYGDEVLRVKHTVTEVTALPCSKHETLLSWKTQHTRIAFWTSVG